MDALKRHLDDHGFTLDEHEPIMKVQAFKSSGKWYATQFDYLDPDIVTLIENQKSSDIVQRILTNHKYDSIGKYSPIMNGFLDGYIYIIEVFNVEGFCTFLINKVRE